MSDQSILKNYVMRPSDSNLDFWIQNNLNVLLIGHAGVGKTSMVLQAFERNKLKYRYFSASTMDPWVDLVGIPREVTDPDTGIKYLDLIRPKDFANDEVEVIFLDEYNRSHPKVRNATMELIQFKSINGKKFPRLKMVWAAINPPTDGDEANYDVHEMDTAQRDRFQVQIELPYKPDAEYFSAKYGKDITDASMDFWNGLSDKLKFAVSPRRLDMALDVYTKGGNIKHLLSPDIGVEKFLTLLKNGGYRRKIEEMIASNKTDELKNWISDENNYSCVEKDFISGKYTEALAYLGNEKLMKLITAHEKIRNTVMKNYSKFKPFIEHVAQHGEYSLKKTAECVLRENNPKYQQYAQLEKGSTKTKIMHANFPSTRKIISDGIGLTKTATKIGNIRLKYNVVPNNPHTYLKKLMKKHFPTMIDVHTAAANGIVARTRSARTSLLNNIGHLIKTKDEAFMAMDILECLVKSWPKVGVSAQMIIISQIVRDAIDIIISNTPDIKAEPSILSVDFPNLISYMYMSGVLNNSYILEA